MIEMNIEQILKRIKIRRMALGISQTEIAKLIGIDQPAYNRLEHNKQTLTVDILSKILEVLHLKVSDIEKEEDGELPLPTSNNEGIDDALILIKDVLKINNSEILFALKSIVEANKEIANAILAKKTTANFKYSSSYKLIEKLEELPNADKIIQQMTFVIIRHPQLIIQQYGSEVYEMQEQLSTELHNKKTVQNHPKQKKRQKA